MLALKILDIKDFTNKLFLKEVFDSFWLVEADITAGQTFSIDGKLMRDFFDSDQLEILDRTGRTFALWKEMRPHCLSVIRGKRTPLAFKIVFQLSRQKTAALIEQSGLAVPAENVSGLYLNIQYRSKTLLCTTGTAFCTFLPDKKPEQLWDGMVLNYFRQNGILFEEA